ncbi:hypothetical protein CLOM_g21591 [Closterium sp. NIES-68]|nr:hypothetical protein CLOM_g21591 [Closterium sp. NIES-68]GJP59818.1 hypothetical protein CLOP_g15308 [Closterium sp. NIES-67]
MAARDAEQAQSLSTDPRFTIGDDAETHDDDVSDVAHEVVVVTNGFRSGDLSWQQQAKSSSSPVTTTLIRPGKLESQDNSDANNEFDNREDGSEDREPMLKSPSGAASGKIKSFSLEPSGHGSGGGGGGGHHGLGGGHGFAGATVSSGIFNLSTSIIGAGIMGLPATLNVLGLPLGVLLLVAMGLLTELSIEVLVNASAVRRIWTYSGLVVEDCGQRSRLVLDLAVLVNNVGMCTVYLIIVADVVAGTSWQHATSSPVEAMREASLHEGLLAEWGLVAGAWWPMRPIVIISTMLLVLAPLVSLKHVDSLHYTSALSILLAVVFVVITVAVAAAQWVQGRIQLPRMLPACSSLKDLTGLFSVIPVMATAYACHYNVHSIFVELKERTAATMLRVTRSSLLLCTTVYVLTSVSAFLLFGSSTASDVLINFDRDLGLPLSSLINDTVRVTYVLHIVFVFPVIFYSLRIIADDLIFPGAEKPLLEDDRRFAVVTVGGMVLVGVGAVMVPNIGLAFDITGATATMLLAFVFPALLTLKDRLGLFASWHRAVAHFLLVFAAIVSVTGLSSGLYHAFVSSAE